MLKIDLIRHGRSFANASNKYSNFIEDSLDPSSEKELEIIKRILSAITYTKVFSSPYRRCRETAERILSPSSAPIIIEDAICEMSLGPWENMTPTDIEKNYPKEWELWNTSPEKLSLPGRETLFEVRDRALSWLLNIISSNNSGTILVVTHVVVIRAILAHYLNVQPSLIRHMFVPNLKLYRLDFCESDPVIWELNNEIYHAYRTSKNTW